MPFKRTDEGVPEDTDGHMPRIKLPEPALETGEPESADTEGQALRSGRVKDGSEPESDDVEGNRHKFH